MTGIAQILHDSNAANPSRAEKRQPLLPPGSGLQGAGDFTPQKALTCDGALLGPADCVSRFAMVARLSWPVHCCGGPPRDRRRLFPYGSRHAVNVGSEQQGCRVPDCSAPPPCGCSIRRWRMPRTDRRAADVSPRSSPALRCSAVRLGRRRRLRLSLRSCSLSRANWPWRSFLTAQLDRYAAVLRSRRR